MDPNLMMLVAWRQQQELASQKVKLEAERSRIEAERRVRSREIAEALAKIEKRERRLRNAGLDDVAVTEPVPVEDFNPLWNNTGLLLGTQVEEVTSKGVRVIAATSDPDRLHDVIVIGEKLNEGLDCTDFLRNPTILFGHDYKSLPVGKAVKIGKANGKLVLEVEHAPTDMGREVGQLVKSGVLRTMSVGLHVIEAEPRRGGGRLITKSSLLECSWVVVPANPHAAIVENSLDRMRPIDDHRRLMAQVGRDALPGLRKVAERNERKHEREAVAVMEPGTPYFRGEEI